MWELRNITSYRRLRDCFLPPTGQKDNRPLDKFQLTFPLRTNYMYAKVKKSLPEMYAFTVCMWIKSNASPGVGTPFSYAVPGQANELVLIEWGNNPMEILINDKVNSMDHTETLSNSKTALIMSRMSRRIAQSNQTVKQLTGHWFCTAQTDDPRISFTFAGYWWGFVIQQEHIS